MFMNRSVTSSLTLIIVRTTSRRCETSGRASMTRSGPRLSSWRGTGEWPRPTPGPLWSPSMGLMRDLTASELESPALTIPWETSALRRLSGRSTRWEKLIINNHYANHLFSRVLSWKWMILETFWSRDCPRVQSTPKTLQKKTPFQTKLLNCKTDF